MGESEKEDSLAINEPTELLKHSGLKRLSVGIIWRDIMSVLNLERGIFYTIWGLIVRPKAIVDEYLFSNRRKGAHPVRFLLLTTTLAALISFQVLSKSNSFMAGFELGEETFEKAKENSEKEIPPVEYNATEEADISVEDDSTVKIGTDGFSFQFDESEAGLAKEEIGKMVMTYMQTAINIFTLFSVPFLALLTYLFYRKRKRFFAEHLVAAAFCISIQNVWSILTSGIQLMDPVIGTLATSLSGIYIVYFIVAVYGEISIKSIFKSCVVYGMWIFVTAGLAMAALMGTFTFWVIDL